ncbi:MAG: DUF6256 family protein [Streptosporangiaceae bacterium]
MTGYVLLMAVLAIGLWTAARRVRSGLPLTRYTGWAGRGWPALLWHVLTDALGGYLLLAAVVVLYYYLVARVGSDFLDSAFSGTALLLGVALPVFLAGSWLSLRRGNGKAGRRHRPDRAGPDRAGPDRAGNGPDGAGQADP